MRHLAAAGDLDAVAIDPVEVVAVAEDLALGGGVGAAVDGDVGADDPCVVAGDRGQPERGVRGSGLRPLCSRALSISVLPPICGNGSPIIRGASSKPAL